MYVLCFRYVVYELLYMYMILYCSNVENYRCNLIINLFGWYLYIYVLIMLFFNKLVFFVIGLI